MAVCLKSSELLDHAKQLLDETRQVSEVTYRAVMPSLAVTVNGFSLNQVFSLFVGSYWRLVSQLAGLNHISCTLQVIIIIVIDQTKENGAAGTL